MRYESALIEPMRSKHLPKFHDFFTLGYSAGRHYLEGGGTNLLCLPEKPNWNRYSDSADSYRGHIWGAEIDMGVDSEGKVFEDGRKGLALCSMHDVTFDYTHVSWASYLFLGLVNGVFRLLNDKLSQSSP